MARKATHILRAALWDEDARRDIEIGSDASLYDLAKAIVGAFDFDFDHAFGFYAGLTYDSLRENLPRYELFKDMDDEGGVKDPDMEDVLGVKATRIADAFLEIGSALTFLFDYGDEWLFRVEVIGRGEKAPKTRYPRIVARVGDAPEQYPAWDDEDGA